MSLATYQQLRSDYSAVYTQLNRKLGWLSFARVLTFFLIIASGYYYLVKDNHYFLSIFILLIIVFLWLIRLYDIIKRDADFHKELIKINDDEMAFLNGTPLPHTTGVEYIDPHHSYTYDLDIFGEGSLFAFINRASTPFGHKKLAESLLAPDTNSIPARQKSIAELSQKIDFRQKLQANGSIYLAKDKDLNQLKQWLDAPAAFSRSAYYYLLLVFPVAVLFSLGLYFFSGSDKHLNIFFALFVLNLFITSFFIRRMLKQVSVSTTVTKALEQFKGQLKLIGKESFHSPLLRELQSSLQEVNESAGASIQRLSSLFRYLDFILNLVVSSFLNGLFLFHIHVLFGLDRWRMKKAGKVMSWLGILGEFESLNSYANFSFNNPAYCFPQLSSELTLSATELAHPLIRKDKTIGNNISFERQQLIILTGSNMSGKSTFLRTVGINMVLARAGSAVSAKEFTFFPFELCVSMRITDSLQDSESFFYAELKRLQQIIRQLEQNRKTFILLDEILRGTNSNDKHTGTIGLIRKLAAFQAHCIIATHDLTVASLAAEYPDYMGNRCFESTITNDELIFDYKLKEGVCSKLNASFLMKKMGVIE
jgi:hypothetical protein